MPSTRTRRPTDDYTPRDTWGAPRLPDSPSIRMDVWKGEGIASTEEELLAGIQGRSREDSDRDVASGLRRVP